MPFAIGIEYGKNSLNVGTLMRSAWNMGAAMVFTVGRRYKREPSDVTATWKKLPILHFDDWDSARRNLPMDWVPVAVELAEGAESLVTFEHPRCAVYILGPEDGSISYGAISPVRRRVVIPSRLCLNVAVAGSIVMYDRLAKMPDEIAWAPAAAGPVRVVRGEAK